MQDLTQKERVEEGLLASLVGCGCESVMPILPRNEGAPEYGGACGVCPAGAPEARACGFGVEAGPLAAVWTPLQSFAGIYDLDTAFARGTMYEGLDKPFFGDERGGNCRG